MRAVTYLTGKHRPVQDFSQEVFSGDVHQSGWDWEQVYDIAVSINGGVLLVLITK